MSEFREGEKKDDFLLKSEDCQSESADWRRN